MEKLEKGPIPLYYQLEKILRQRIRIKKYSSNNLLPTETELCQEFGVSRATVRQAVKTLELDGLVERTRGVGTMIVPLNKEMQARLYGSFGRLFLPIKGSTELISKKLITPDEEVVADMRLNVGEKVFLFEAVRKDTSMSIFTYLQAHVPKDLGAKISIKNKQEHRLLIERIEALTGEITYRIMWYIKAISGPRNICRKLNVKDGTPILFGKRLYFSKDDRCLQRILSYESGENYQAQLEMILSPSKFKEYPAEILANLEHPSP